MRGHGTGRLTLGGLVLAGTLLAGCGGVDEPTTDTAPATATAPVPGAEEAVGPDGQRLTASPVAGLSGRETIEVTGTGYDTATGIYVAFCVAPEPGQPPSPCGGGVDTTGSTGASFWISSNPPPYGKGLAQPFGADGSFAVTLTVQPTIGEVDCRESTCVVATRADHTRSSDRSADVLIPVTFDKESQ